MKRTMQIIGAGVLALALGGCFGGDDDNVVMTPMPEPAPQPEPEPEPEPQPQAVSFVQFVHAQFDADVRDSATASSEKINDVNFTFAEMPSHDDYADLFANASGN